MAFYVYCDDNCRYEAMTKEEILTAIEQAIRQGHVSDPDGAVFSRIKEIRAGQCEQLWVGTEDEFNALDPAPQYGRSTVRVGENGVLYLCSDEALFEQIDDHIANKNNPHEVTFEQVIGAGAVPVKSGGTGNNEGRAKSADKLAFPRGIQVNLENESPAEFNGTMNVAPGVTGILKQKNGGTGSATPKGAEYNMLGGMPESVNPIVPVNQFVFRRSTPNVAEGVLVSKSAAVVWEWIVTIIRETLGVHDVVYSATEPEYVEGRVWLKPVE